MLVYKESSRRAHEDFINISMTLEMWLELDKIMKGMQNTVRCHLVIIRAKALPDRTITKKRTWDNSERLKEHVKDPREWS